MADRSMFGPDWTVIPTGSGNEHHLMDHRGKVVATGYKAEKMQRLATCVNALDGIDDPATDLAIAVAARRWHAALQQWNAAMDSRSPDEVDFAESEANKAEAELLELLDKGDE